MSEYLPPTMEPHKNPAPGLMTNSPDARAPVSWNRGLMTARIDASSEYCVQAKSPQLRSYCESEQGHTRNAVGATASRTFGRRRSAPALKIWPWWRSHLLNVPLMSACALSAIDGTNKKELTRPTAAIAVWIQKTTRHER